MNMWNMRMALMFKILDIYSLVFFDSTSVLIFIFILVLIEMCEGWLTKFNDFQSAGLIDGY